MLLDEDYCNVLSAVSLMSCWCCVCQESGDADHMEFMWWEFGEIERSLESLRRSTLQHVGKIRQQLITRLTELQEFEEGVFSSLNKVAE